LHGEDDFDEVKDIANVILSVPVVLGLMNVACPTKNKCINTEVRTSIEQKTQRKLFWSVLGGASSKALEKTPNQAPWKAINLINSVF